MSLIERERDSLFFEDEGDASEDTSRRTRLLIVQQALSLNNPSTFEAPTDGAVPPTLLGQLKSLRLSPAVALAPQLPGASSYPLQEWEGVVQWVEGDEFGARLTDIAEEGAPEESIFSIREEVSRDDRPLVRVGALFSWTIERRRELTGQIMHASVLRFRRILRTPETRAAVEERAAEITRRLGLD
jgi:hypothetical protein